MGDLVLWRQASSVAGVLGVNQKLTNKYSVPYKVTKVLGNDRYQIAAVKGVRGYKKFTVIASAESVRRYRSITATGESGNIGDDEDCDEAMDHQDLIDLFEG